LGCLGCFWFGLLPLFCCPAALCISERVFTGRGRPLRFCVLPFSLLLGRFLTCGCFNLSFLPVCVSKPRWVFLPPGLFFLHYFLLGAPFMMSPLIVFLAILKDCAPLLIAACSSLLYCDRRVVPDLLPVSTPWSLMGRICSLLLSPSANFQCVFAPNL